MATGRGLWAAPVDTHCEVNTKRISRLESGNAHDQESVLCDLGQSTGG